MQSIFLELVKLSLTGSLFALAVMLVRLIFRKAPKWLFCVLWGVVALRLICPVSIESAVSLVPDRLASGQIITNVGNEYVGEVDIIYESDVGYNNAVQAGRQPVFSNEGYYVVTEKNSLEAPKTVEETVYPVLGWIWLAGMGLMFAYTAVSYLVLRKRMSEATRLRENIWQCEQVESPFVLGMIKPRIYLPYAITESDMMNVIAHEQAHICRKDHWWKPLGFLLLSVHWFNPVLWFAYILLCRDIEAACDEKVIKHMEKDDVRAYSTALLNCSVHRRRIAACPLAFGETGVKERIKRVMNYKKPAFWIILVAILICTVVAVCFLTNPSTSPEFAMNGNNVRNLDVDTIIGRIQKAEGLGDGNAYINSNNFHLIIDSDFNWVDSQTVRYFFYKGKETHSAQLRIFPEENKYFITESSEWREQDNIFLLRNYLDAIKYLPQEAIRQMAPADRYIVRQIEEGTPNNYSRVITYTPNGTEQTEDWLIHLQVEPLHAADEGYEGAGDEVIQLFYANANDQIGDINELLSLVSEIANNPDCGLSSNPYTYIEAKRELYDAILSYKGQAVDCFVEQLRTGENGLRGYIMAAACSEITGVGEKVGEYDTSWWVTAQEWLALYESATAQALPRNMTIADVIALSKKGNDLTYEDLSIFKYRDIGSGTYTYRYDIDSDFYLLVPGGLTTGKTGGTLFSIHAGGYIDLSDSGVEAFIETHRADALNRAITDAVGEHYMAGIMQAQSFVLIADEVDITKNAQSPYVKELTLYLLVHNKAYTVKNGYYKKVDAGKFIPTMIRFGVDSAGSYKLLQYWTPSSELEPFVRKEVLEKFPEGVAEEVLNFDYFSDKLYEQWNSIVLNRVSLAHTDLGLPLNQKYPEYFQLDTDKGLGVFVYQMTPNSYSCILLRGTNAGDGLEYLGGKPGTSLDEMRQIVQSYGLDRSQISIIPFQMPYSSYQYTIDDAYKAKVEALFWSGYEDVQVDKPQEIGSIIIDIDGDFYEEKCVLLHGPTSGLMSFSVAVYSIEDADRDPTYSGAYYLFGYDKVFLQKSRSDFLIRCYNSAEPNRPLTLVVEIANNRIQIHCDEEGVLRELPQMVTPPKPESAFNKPPELMIHTSDKDITITASGYHWTYENPDGTAVSVIADQAGRPIEQRFLEPIVIDGKFAESIHAYVPQTGKYEPINSAGVLVKLDWQTAPTSVAFTCWDDSVYSSENSSERQVFNMEDDGFYAYHFGGYIYEIAATWEDTGEGYHGTANYYVYIICSTE